MHVQTIPIAQIEIRERVRTTLTEIEDLAESIKERGLLQPVVVRCDGPAFVLVAGQRRLAALASLGKTEAAAHVVGNIDDELEALLSEGDENTKRVPFDPDDACTLADRIEGLERVRSERRRAAASKRAAERSAAARANPTPEGQTALPFKAPEPSVNSAEGLPAKPGRTARERAAGETRNRVAKAVGMSAPTLAKARHIVKTAESPDVPEIVREEARVAKRQMKESGQVDGAYKRVKLAEQQAVADEARGRVAGEAAGVDVRIEQDAEFVLEAKRKVVRADFMRVLPKMVSLIAFKPEDVADLLDEHCMLALRSLRKQIDDYHDSIELNRMINGG